MTLNIFSVDTAPEEMEKQANLSIQLTSPPEEWDQEVMEYAYRLHPWLADFTVTTEFIKKLPDRQYGLGSLTVRPKQALVPTSKGTAGKPMSPEASTVLAHIPIIIREGSMSPIDVFLSGTSVYPLNEDAFRKKVGKALDADSTSPSRNDPTLIGHLWPPGRSTFGGPGAEMGMSILNKFSSVEEDNLVCLEPEWVKLAEDEIVLLEGLAGYPLVQGILAGDLAYSADKAVKLAEDIKGSTYLRPIMGDLISDISQNLPGAKAPRGKVAQLVKGASGYVLRSTNPKGFSFDRGVAVEEVGLRDTYDASVFTSMKPSATIGLSNKTAAAEGDILDFGSAVLREGTREREGFYFRDVIDFDGEKTGSSLFVDPSRQSWSMEEDFAGVRPGEKAAELDNNPMEGTGVFAMKTASGEIACTVPITLHRQDISKSGPMFHATVHSTKLAGEYPIDTAVKLFFTPAITQPVYVAKTASLMLPTNYSWMQIGADRFRPYNPIDINTGVVTVTKLAGDTYTLEGSPVEHVIHKPLDATDTQFALAALGVGVADIPDVLKEASTTLSNCNELSPGEAPAVEIPVVSGDPELLKAAAYLSDPNTVDSVLGLSLLDFEIEDDYMLLAQNLEQTQQKVARLLLLSRLGLYTIPEGASKVVMLRLTPVIDSLKILAMQQAYTN